MSELNFAKAHGTENDFVIISDPGDEIDLTPGLVSGICDRRAGLGADGVLRAVRDGDGTWFMDYRNADGSLAEMCGNGARVFAHWLAVEEGVDTSRFTIRTRAGDRPVTVHSADRVSARVSVEMGPVTVTGVSTARMGAFSFAGLGVDVGNPHLAAVIPGLTAQQLARLELTEPQFDGAFFPHGVNIEIATPLQGSKVHMRVYERGVGETRSCGTGTVAAAAAALADAGAGEGTVTVHVPGGAVEVEISDRAVLTGPSRIIARGVVDTAGI